jgi:hypothetical protein
MENCQQQSLFHVVLETKRGMSSLKEGVMFTPRRIYIYVVSAISLNAVAWAIISLLRNLLISKLKPDVTSLAFQTAVILIGLPVFLVHWFWAQRLCRRDEEERGAVLRKIYFYGIQAAFLIPIIDSTLAVLSTLFLLPTHRISRMFYPKLSSGETILYYLIAVIVLGALWYYQQLVKNEDVKITPEAGESAAVRRLFIFSFSAAGLSMTTLAFINLIRWIMFELGGRTETLIFGGGDSIYDIARLVVGIPLWLVFWTWAGRLFIGPEVEERESILRKFYLYLVILLSVLASVTSITYILEGLFRRLLNVTSADASSGDIRLPISIIIGTGIVWAYHAYVLREDTKKVEDIPRQQAIKRIYFYLVAGIGLAAFLSGVSGDLSVLIRSLDQGAFIMDFKRQLTWFLSVTIAGLPVWILPWRQVQEQTLLSGLEGVRERQSVVRKTYLYFFIFIATLTVLSSVIFIVFKILSMVLGEPSPTISELGQPLAYSLIAVGVLLYHGSLLREDQRRLKADQTVQYKDFQITVVDLIDRDLTQSFIDRLKTEIPGALLSIITLDQEGGDTEVEVEKQGLLEKINNAKVIVGPWMMTVSGWGDGLVSDDIAQAIMKSPARKILIPLRADRWEWAGVEHLKKDILIRQIVRAVRQALGGEEVKLVKPLGAGAIIGIVIAAILILSLLSIPLIYLLIY